VQSYASPSRTVDIPVSDGFVHVAPSCRYLGSIITTNFSDSEDILGRVTASAAAFGALKFHIFCNNDLRLRAKSVYHSPVLTILLYGDETWAITEPCAPWSHKPPSQLPTRPGLLPVLCFRPSLPRVLPALPSTFALVARTPPDPPPLSTHLSAYPPRDSPPPTPRPCPAPPSRASPPPGGVCPGGDGFPEARATGDEQVASASRG